MSGKICVFKSRPKRSDSKAGPRNESGSEFLTVRPATGKEPSAVTKPRNVQFATAGRTQMLAAGNFGDWHAAVGEVQNWSSLPKIPMNSHGKLVLHSLWNNQPVQVITGCQAV